jgi:oligopeptide/dipeptide ABC transporter ATP-binding protein
VKPLLEVDNLTVHFPAGRGLLTGRRQVVHAVDGISFSLAEGQTLGVVGESGCGKTTLGLAILKLIPLTSGRVSYQGQDLSALSDRQMRRFRREMQIIFQDPYSSLNPRMTVRRIISDPMRVHRRRNAGEMRDRVDYLLEKVGLTPDQADRYPHEFSGGQRQRIGIARALSLEPKLIIADEPVSALDVSIQAQIINLLLDLHDEFGLSYIFISHDLAVVEYICDHVAVMYLGQIVETAPYREIYTNPLHPYTQALLSAVPAFDPATPYEMSVPAGDVPNPVRPPPGCRFHPRCPVRMEDCRLTAPALNEVSPGHFVACLLLNSNKRKGEL